MELASQIFDTIVEQEPERVDWLPDPTYARKIVRLAALSHDLGHLPFSHVGEKSILGPGGHEEKTVQILRSHWLTPIWRAAGGIEIAEDVIELAVGKSGGSGWHGVLNQIIAGDFFGADRIDYLLRDSRYTGVAYGTFDYRQLIEMLRILLFEDHLQVGIEEGGIEACEALLLARHFMQQRVYHYEAVKGYAFHLSRYMKKLLGEGFAQRPLEEYLAWSDNEILFHMRNSQDEDARCLLDRKKRYHALYLPQLPGSILTALQESGYFVENFDEEPAKEPPFPVLKMQGEIVSGDRMLQVQIPLKRGLWIYSPPDRYQALLTELQPFL